MLNTLCRKKYKVELYLVGFLLVLNRKSGTFSLEMSISNYVKIYNFNMLIKISFWHKVQSCIKYIYFSLKITGTILGIQV